MNTSVHRVTNAWLTTASSVAITTSPEGKSLETFDACGNSERMQRVQTFRLAGQMRRLDDPFTRNVFVREPWALFRDPITGYSSGEAESCPAQRVCDALITASRYACDAALMSTPLPATMIFASKRANADDCVEERKRKLSAPHARPRTRTERSKQHDRDGICSPWLGERFALQDATETSDCV